MLSFLLPAINANYKISLIFLSSGCLFSFQIILASELLFEWREMEFCFAIHFVQFSHEWRKKMNQFLIVYAPVFTNALIWLSSRDSDYI